MAQVGYRRLGRSGRTSGLFLKNLFNVSKGTSTTMQILSTTIRGLALLTNKTFAVCLLAGLLALVSGCSKPPGCSDTKVVELAKQIIDENVIKKADPNSLSKTHVALSLITESGYNSDVAKWSCSTQATLQTSAESLTMANEEIRLIQTVTHPTAAQAMQLSMYRIAGKMVLTDEEEALVPILEARNWKPFSQDDLKSQFNFTSQFESGSKNLVVQVEGGSAEVRQFPLLARLGFERHQRDEKAKTSAAQTSSSSAGGSEKAVKINVAKAEMCGPEALCITDTSGTTYTGNATTLSDADRTYINDAAKGRSEACLKDVTADKTFESAGKC